MRRYILVEEGTAGAAAAVAAAVAGAGAGASGGRGAKRRRSDAQSDGPEAPPAKAARVASKVSDVRDGTADIGRRVAVWWVLETQFFTGKVVAFDARKAGLTTSCPARHPATYYTLVP